MTIIAAVALGLFASFGDINVNNIDTAIHLAQRDIDEYEDEQDVLIEGEFDLSEVRRKKLKWEDFKLETIFPSEQPASGYFFTMDLLTKVSARLTG